MNQSDFLKVLTDYIDRLARLESAFVKPSSGGYYLMENDEALLKQTVQEMIDLFNDSVLNNTYSSRVAGIANDGYVGYPARFSLNSVRELRSLTEAIKTRVERSASVLKVSGQPPLAIGDYWKLLHPKVVAFAKSRMESGHYADAVEACFKELNNDVKLRHQNFTGVELDGVDLMRKAFKLDAPSILLDQMLDDTGKNIQRGYLDLFAGSMAGIRNPKAHGNIQITLERAIHFLFLASLLFSKLDEAI